MMLADSYERVLGDTEYRKLARIERYKGDQEYRLLYDRVAGLVKSLIMLTDLGKVEKPQWGSHQAQEAIVLYSLHEEYRLFHNGVSELLDELLPLETSEKEKEEAGAADPAVSRYGTDLDYRKVHDRICDSIVQPVKTYQCKSLLGYLCELEDLEEAVSDVIDKVLKPVREKGASKFNNEMNRQIYRSSPMLPHKIVHDVQSGPYQKHGELGWKKLIDSYANKFKRWVAVCDTDKEAVCDTDKEAIYDTVNYSCLDKVAIEVSVAIGLFVSDLAEEPWKGKVISYAEEPRTCYLGGLDDVLTKYKMVSRMDRSSCINFKKVFGLILKLAVENNLKRKQMVKRVLVLTPQDFDAEIERRWEDSHPQIKSKFEKKGYAMPTMIFWSLLVNNTWNTKTLVVPRILPGARTYRGYSNDLISFFLQNNGKICPDKFRKHFHLPPLESPKGDDIDC